MVTFLLRTVSTINTAAAPAGPATPTGLYANTLVTQKYLQWNATAGATGYVLYRSTRLMEFMML
jgi:hypothetical protein